nr:uncharacterized protein LOC113821780 [Penaeus vannamei]
MGVGVLVWRRWPLKDPSREQVVLRGHEIHQLEFSSNGKFVGILSTREESLYDADAEDEETEVKEESEDQRRGQAAGEGEKKTKEGETEERRKRRKGASAERRHELLLSLWQWPEVDEGGGGVESPVEAGVPRRLVMTRVTQLRSHQVTRMSLARGVPQGVLAVVIAAEDELWAWRLEEGPLGRRLVSSTIGFGLLPPDTVLTSWCLSGDAYALGVGGGWVMVSAGGEVRARMGGGGRGGPCHDGPLTDLYLHGSHLYTTGGDGWLRVWEAETLEEAAVTAAGNASHEGWCETGVRTVSLQLVREVLVHVGPGAPVTLIPPSRLTWCGFCRPTRAWFTGCGREDGRRRFCIRGQVGASRALPWRPHTLS